MYHHLNYEDFQILHVFFITEIGTSMQFRLENPGLDKPLLDKSTLLSLRHAHFVNLFFERSAVLPPELFSKIYDMAKISRGNSFAKRHFFLLLFDIVLDPEINE